MKKKRSRKSFPSRKRNLSSKQKNRKKEVEEEQRAQPKDDTTSVSKKETETVYKTSEEVPRRRRTTESSQDSSEKEAQPRRRGLERWGKLKQEVGEHRLEQIKKTEIRTIEEDYESKTDRKGISRPLDSLGYQRQYEDSYEVTKTRRGLVGSYPTRGSQWEEEEFKTDLRKDWKASGTHDQKEIGRERKKRPTFCTRLMDRTATQGSIVKLSCTVLSHPEPSIQWLKDGTPIFVKSTDYSSGRFRSKLHSGIATLEISDVVPGDSGEYTCLAQNPLGEVSTTSTLKVFGGYEPAPFPPTFTRPIRESYKYSEDELTLECRVRSQPTSRVVWLKNGNPIRASTRYQLTEKSDGLCVLTIFHPEADDSGEYTCKAENAVSSATSSHYVNFTGRQQYLETRRTDRRSEGRRTRDYQSPHFNLGLTDHLVPIGGTIALQVELRGTPREVKWLRGAEELPRASSRIRSFEDAGVYTLLVSDASEKEAGTYTCRAYSTYGHIDTTAAVEVVPPGAITGKPPKIISRPSNMMTVTVEDDIIFTCRVIGDPKPRVTWFKGVKDITITPRTMVEHSDDYYKFSLKKAVPADAGTYWIVAKNLYGCDRAFVTVQIKQRARSLTPGPFSSSRWNYPTETVKDTKEKERYRVKETPGPISNEPFVADSGRNWLTLSWKKPTNRGAAPVIAYRVDIWQVGEDSGARWAELGVSPVNTFDVFNLKPGAEYKFRITPRNRYGWGEPFVTSTPLGVGNKVINLPEFVKILPGQMKALLRSEIKLECQVASDVIPTITWYRDSVPIDFDNTQRYSSKFDGRNCQLRIEDLKEEDSGRYMCEAVNRMGRASTFARLMVVSDPKILEADTHLKRERLEGEEAAERFPPQFTMRLRDRRVQMTYPVRLTCQVLGCPTPEVSWYRDGNLVTQDDRHAFTSEDHFHTLEISKTILEDSGCYTATARNDHGSVSCHCNLVVDKGIRAYVAPEFVAELPETRKVKYGEELRLSAQVEAYPSVGVVWHRNGVRLRPSRRIIMTLDHDGTIELAIAGITERESGAYTCTATNEVGRSETTCKVTVVSETSSSSMPQIQEPQTMYSKAPLFITKPRSSEAVEGDTVIIDCEVIGDPKPEVFWLRDFLKPDYYRDSPNFRRLGDGPSYRLEIPHAKLDFTGTYSVVARNVHGEAKAVISLQIYAKGQGKEDRMDHSPVTHGNVETLPVFKKGLKDLRCCDGDAVTLECVVSSATPPEIRWEKGGKLLPLNNDFVANFDGKTATLTIKQVYPEDEGEYTCLAYNEVGRTSTSACLVVDVPEEKENLLSRQLTRPSGLMSSNSTPRSTPRTTPSRSISPGYGWRESSTSSLRQKRLKVAPPKFYAVPHNRIAEEGETVRFQCAVAGHPTPWVTWDKDNIVVTPSARITISEKEDLKILEIEEVTFEDAGLYRVTLENEVGRVEATARLDVMGPRGYKSRAQNVRSFSASPTFRRRLMGSVGRIGGNVTLACDIKSNPSPVTSWYRNGELVVRTSRISPTWDGHTAMLEIENLEIEDAGIYTCVAENEAGKCHCSAELTVLDADDEDAEDLDTMPPVFLEGLKDVTVEEGYPAELQVRVKGSAPLDIVWVKNNKEIPNCEDFRYVDYDDGRFGLRIADVFSEDSGEYLCEVFNQHGEAASSAHLLVKETVTTKPPKIEFSKKPTSVVVACGRSVSFCCRLQSQTSEFGRPVVQWKIGNRILGPDTVSTKYSVEENDDISILHIDSVDRKDGGPIICTARYQCSLCSSEPSSSKCSCRDSTTTCSAELTVTPGNGRDNWSTSDGECEMINVKKIRSRSLSTSEIEADLSKMLRNRSRHTNDTDSSDKSRALLVRGPADANVFRGERVVLRATYCGQPEPRVRWLKGGRVLENNDRITIITGGGTTSLSFDCINADDSGKYVVCVENDHGTDCHFASVAVEGPPDPPASFPIVTNVGNNSVEIEWSSPAFDGGSKITGYVVEMKNSAQGDWTPISGLCHSLSFTIKNLQSNTKYRFRVKAENIHGQSEPSYESNEIAVISESTDFGCQFEPRIVSIESGEVFKAKYEVLEELGKGRYGVVHKVADLETGQKLAAKFIRCIKMKDREKVKEEIEIMNSLSHPKLLQLAAAFESPREVVMVMEYISGGELFERVVADDFQLTERDCILFMRQICEGVEYMHKNNVVHLDLKPENIMCQSRTSHEIKLIDFGLAKRLDPEVPVRVLFGTPEFVPPEIINYEPIGFESDMWSVGVICYVLLSGLSPFMGENDAETFANITRSSYDFDDEAFSAISQDAKDFISSLLVKRKEKRLTASECLKNKWMMSEHDKTMGVILSTDKLKKFIIRRKWQKTGNAIRALGRMASLSAASRKNSAQNNQVKASGEDTNQTVTVDACGINSSPNKSCVHKAMTEKIKNIGTIEEENKDSGSKDDKYRSRVCSERSDSGISDCSSVGSGSSHPHACQCQTSNTPLLHKKYSITEEEESKSCKTDNTTRESVPSQVEAKPEGGKLPKEAIGTKVDVIRKKFANLSKNIDEMDKKLETVGKKLVDIGPGKITTSKRPEIKRIPSLKEHKNPEAKKSHLMQHTASSQAKITTTPKQTSTPVKDTSSLTIPVSPDLRTSRLSRTRSPSTNQKPNLSSGSFPTAKSKLPEGVKTTSSEIGGDSSRASTKPSTKIQKLQQIYNSKVTIQGTKNTTDKPEVGNQTKTGPSRKIKDITDNPKTIHGGNSLNFQQAVAFWKR